MLVAGDGVCVVEEKIGCGGLVACLVIMKTRFQAFLNDTVVNGRKCIILRFYHTYLSNEPVYRITALPLDEKKGFKAKFLFFHFASI